MPPAFEDQFLGQIINGRFRIKGVRLRGVFSTLFLAEEFFCRTFVRQVLVKVSRQTGMTQVTAPHFFDDAIRLSQVLAGEPAWLRQHLPAVLDMGLERGRGVLVTEAVNGTPLLAWQVQGQRLDFAAQVTVFTDLCRILATLHRHGIVHRELRPEAVLIDAAGQVRLLGLGLATSADWRQAVAEAAPELRARLAPEVIQGNFGPAADVYALGLLLTEWLTGGASHLTPPSVLRSEIRQAMPWLDDVVQRCVASESARRFRDAQHLLDALTTGASTGVLPPLEPLVPGEPAAAPVPPRPSDNPAEQRIRDARRFLARGDFGKAIDHLDIHRPVEWAVVDRQGAQILRILGQAYVGRGDWRSACECLEQLRSVQREQALLPAPSFAAALTDLLRSYTALGLKEQAEAIRQEVQMLLMQAR
jgi:serine/threonine protein kinase